MFEPDALTRRRPVLMSAVGAALLQCKTPMTARGAFAPVLLAAVVGAALWFAASLLTGTREAWDAGSYWVIVYPVCILTCAYLGYAYPARPWRWALVLFASQFVAMSVRNGELGNLWPLGLALFAVIALPGVLAGTLASRLRGGSPEGTV